MDKNVLKAWKTNNTVAKGDKTEKILMLESTRSVNQEFVIDRMANLNPGILKDTMRLAVKLHNQVVSQLVLSGYSVNTDLFRAVARFKGVIKNNQWNQEQNSIYVSLTQGKQLRQAIKNTTVDILGEKQGSIYISASHNTATRATNFTATAGRNLTLLGKNIAIAGTDPSVGITIKANTSSTAIKLTQDMIVINEPSRLILLLPANLLDGKHLLTITTQYTSSKRLLKTPRSITQAIYLGQPTEENPMG